MQARFGATYGLIGDFRDVRTAYRRIEKKARELKIPVAKETTYVGSVNEFLEMAVVFTEKDARKLKRHQAAERKATRDYWEWYETPPSEPRGPEPAKVAPPAWLQAELAKYKRFEDHQEAEPILQALKEDRFDIVTGRIRPTT